MRVNVHLLRAAARFSTPEQTAIAALSGENGDDHAHLALDPVEGWSPRPTQEPFFHDLARRQNDGSLRTCGFLDKDRAKPFTCDISGVCVTDEFLGYAGCCDASDVENCHIATACDDELDAGFEFRGVDDSLTTVCSTGSCARAFLDYSTAIYTQWFCYGFIASTISIYPTYSNPIRSEDFFSASALPADGSVSGGLDNSDDDDGNGNGNGNTDDEGIENEDNDDNGDIGDNGSGSEDGDNTGAIAGGVVGGLVALSIAGLLIWWLLRRRRQKRHNKSPANTGPEPVLKAEMPVTNAINSHNVSMQGVVPTPTTYNEICTDSTVPPIRHELSPSTATSTNIDAYQN